MRESNEITATCVAMKAFLRTKIEAINEIKPEVQINESVDNSTPSGALSTQTTTSSEENKPMIFFKGVKFNGYVTEWMTFFKDFSNAIDAVPEATNKEKLKVLSESCTGMPNNLINACGEDFEKALSALQQVYGSTYKQCMAATAQLFEMKACESSSYDELSKLLSEATKIANWFGELDLKSI